MVHRLSEHAAWTPLLWLPTLGNGTSEQNVPLRSCFLVVSRTGIEPVLAEGRTPEDYSGVVATGRAAFGDMVFRLPWKHSELTHQKVVKESLCRGHQVWQTGRILARVGGSSRTGGQEIRRNEQEVRSSGGTFSCSLDLL
jgi:hypothetical protein